MDLMYWINKVIQSWRNKGLRDNDWTARCAYGSTLCVEFSVYPCKIKRIKHYNNGFSEYNWLLRYLELPVRITSIIG